MYQVELSSVPFPDDPPIVYPAAPIWEDLTNRRKDRSLIAGFIDGEAYRHRRGGARIGQRHPLRAHERAFVFDVERDLLTVES